MKLSHLLKGLPGHPIHPPLTDATIGTYTFATLAALSDAVGWTNNIGTQAWWFALLVGLVLSAITALTGLIDWFAIEWGTEVWKTATTHMIAMLTATLFFALATLFGHDEFLSGNIQADGLIFTLVGFAFLTLGGWLGGTIVFVHGMRVLNLVEEPEKEKAEGE